MVELKQNKIPKYLFIINELFKAKGDALLQNDLYEILKKNINVENTRVNERNLSALTK